MELAFRTRSLREICEDPRKAASQLGDRVATVLQARLADLHAASRVSDLIAGAPRICGPGGTRLMIQLPDSQYLVLQCNHVAVISNPGLVDWTAVTRLQVVSIGKELPSED